jgi:membrane dipeptidase
MIDFFEREVEKHNDIIELALNLEDIERIAREGKVVAILSIEGGESLMGEIKNLDHFYNRGVRILGLTWNRENELGYGQATRSESGLKPFGIEVLKRMDELGMILDVSHLNEAGFWDAHNHSTRPYMASHSNAFEINPHNRNLRNNQISAMVERGGIIGLNMYPLLLSPTENATMDDAVKHIRHFIEAGAGNHIGLGCDFDGIPTKPEGIIDVLSLKAFRERLKEEFGEAASHRVMQGNFYEFFKRYFEE